MPKGVVNRYKVVLKADRRQRKLIDNFLDMANAAAHQAYSEQKVAIEVSVPSRPSELVEKLIPEYPDLSRETLEDAVDCGLETLALYLGGQQGKKRHTRLFAIRADDVIFGMVEKSVRIPHVGVCSFLYNQKGLKALEGFAGKTIRNQVYSVQLGFHNNEPVMFLES